MNHPQISAAALVVAALSSVWLGGCRCQTQTFDQVYLLDATAGTPLSSGDAALDALPADVEAGAEAGAGAQTGAGSLDCTPAAAGCVAGAACPAACECLRNREGLGPISIAKCTLLAGGGPPSVEIRYVVTFSGCGD